METSHALAWVLKNRKKFQPSQHIVVCFSGRGDKDMPILAANSEAQR